MSRNYTRKDRFYQQAKTEGYRSRAAYKLFELDKKFHLLKSGARVLDLGCWPGGWTQVACERVGPKGTVVGVDLEETEPLSPRELKGGCLPILLCADARTSEVQAELISRAGGKFDVILSDMSAKLTGIRFADVTRSADLMQLVLDAVKELLTEAGNVVVKFFPGAETEELVREYRKHFTKIVRIDLDASRKSSTEQYLVALGYRA